MDVANLVINNITEQSLCEAIWDGQLISFVPGRLEVVLRPGVRPKVAYDYLIKAGCEIIWDSIRCGSFLVKVPAKKTLHLAVDLGRRGLFRYVGPVILEKEYFH